MGPVGDLLEHPHRRRALRLRDGARVADERLGRVVAQDEGAALFPGDGHPLAVRPDELADGRAEAAVALRARERLGTGDGGNGRRRGAVARPEGAEDRLAGLKSPRHVAHPGRVAGDGPEGAGVAGEARVGVGALGADRLGEALAGRLPAVAVERLEARPVGAVEARTEVRSRPRRLRRLRCGLGRETGVARRLDLDLWHR